MRLRTFLILVCFLLTGFWSPHAYRLWQDYKEARWHASPLYQYQILLNSVDIVREQARQKYITRFQPAAEAFGEDIKFLKKIEGYPGNEKMVEYYKKKLYNEQFVLMEQWLIYDQLLYPDLYDVKNREDYIANYKPRSI